MTDTQKSSQRNTNRLIKQTHYFWNLEHLDNFVPAMFVNDLLESAEWFDGLPQIGNVRL